MIRSIAHKGLRDFYEKGTHAGIAPAHRQALRDILTALDAAVTVWDLNAPGFGTHPLKGRKAGRFAIRVSGAWRVTFRFEDGEAIEVDYEQYH